MRSFTNLLLGVSCLVAIGCGASDVYEEGLHFDDSELIDAPANPMPSRTEICLRFLDPRTPARCPDYNSCQTSGIIAALPTILVGTPLTLLSSVIGFASAGGTCIAACTCDARAKATESCHRAPGWKAHTPFLKQDVMSVRLQFRNTVADPLRAGAGYTRNERALAILILCQPMHPTRRFEALSYVFASDRAEALLSDIDYGTDGSSDAPPPPLPTREAAGRRAGDRAAVPGSEQPRETGPKRAGNKYTLQEFGQAAALLQVVPDKTEAAYLRALQVEFSPARAESILDDMTAGTTTHNDDAQSLNDLRPEERELIETKPRSWNPFRW